MSQAANNKLNTPKVGGDPNYLLNQPWYQKAQRRLAKKEA